MQKMQEKLFTLYKGMGKNDRYAEGYDNNWEGYVENYN